MTIHEAQSLIEKYEFKSVLSEDEAFLLTEALGFMIEETKNTDYMVRLGGYYYEQKDFDLALKYYEMADSYGDDWAAEGLGYIWYYGRTGERDYEKAFKYYSKAAANGSVRSEMKIADMYKNGYYVEKDYDKYCRIIEELYEESMESPGWHGSTTDIYIRYAKIKREQGDVETAVELMQRARTMLAYRIVGNPFFGDLNVMKWVTEDLYELIDFDPADFDLFDLYYVLKEPCKVSFVYEGEKYTVEAARSGDEVNIRFGDSWYRTIDDFFLKAEIGGERVAVLYGQLLAFEVER